jgi:UV DNA damage endonuclease
MTSEEIPTIGLGLCCINTELRKKDIFCSRTMIRKNFTVERAKELALLNIRDICKLAEYNYNNFIRCFRLSSDIFPHFTDTETEPYTIDFAIPDLKKAGKYVKKYKQRITMHPGQYNQIGTSKRDVFEKTCKELKMHADILDYMGIGDEGVLCIHGGGVYGDKENTIKRWIKQFQELPENVRKRLAIENCERCYSISDCLIISKACNIPIILDSHHYECFNKIYPNNKQDITSMMPYIIETWTRRNITPVFHISEQRPNSRIGAHSDYIENIPEYMLEIPKKYGINLDIEVEAKLKEQAIFRLQEKYTEYMVS